MAVFRKQTTRAVPDGAEQATRAGEPFVRWKDANGKTRTAKLTVGRDGTPRIVTTSKTYTAKYRDATGVVREVATGCRDKQAAQAVLAVLERRVELVKSGVVTPTEDRIADHQSTPLATHVDDFLRHQKAKGTTVGHVRETRRLLGRLAADCGWNRLSDLSREQVERWLTRRADEGMGARNVNVHLSAAVAFANWCISANRLSANPFAGTAKANERADRRRTRRAMTEEELGRLLYVAARRPLAELGRESLPKPQGDPKGRRGWRLAPLTLDTIDDACGRARAKTEPHVAERLERLGRERALVIKTLVTTGLRKGELASITVGQLHLDGPTPCLELMAGDEKNRNGSTIPLRADLASNLRDWIADRERWHRGDGDTLQFAKLPLDARLFVVPTGLVRILDRDLKTAGIPKRDDRGRTIDVHALRHTFASMLSAAGVAPRTAQAAMRHSDINLTMGVYTDPKLLDIGAALDVLPSLPLDGNHPDHRQSHRATGTEGVAAVAPTVAPD